MSESTIPGGDRDRLRVTRSYPSGSQRRKSSKEKENQELSLANKRRKRATDMSAAVSGNEGGEQQFEDVELDEKKSKEDVGLLEGTKGKGKSKKKNEDESRRSPFDEAFFFSKYVTLWWMNGLFSLGNRQTLEEEDICHPPEADSSENVCDRLERSWEQELYDKNGQRKPHPSLTKAVVKTFGLRFALYGILAICVETVRIAQPIFLGFLVRFFTPKTGLTKTDAYIYAFGLTMCSVAMTLCMTPLTLLRQKSGMNVRVAVIGLIYKKVLKLSNAALASTTSGYIVNLVSTDAQRLDFACLFLHYLVLGPCVLVVVAYLLYREIGLACLAGIGLLMLLVPIQMGMGRVLMRFRRKIVKYTDERVKIMNEIISGIRVIKLYTWEIPFTEIVSKLRRNELKAILHLSHLRAGFMSFFFSSASLISFVTFTTYVLTGNFLTAQKVFTCIALFNSARVVMTMFFPIAVTLMNEGRVALERLQKLLLLEDIRKPGSNLSNLRPKPSDCKVELNNLTASWNQDNKTLNNINLKADSADLVAIVGPVGSGKSSLLMALLGELPASGGQVEVKGKISYASQQAWIFNGTLRYNITFGQEYNEEKYKQVLKVCALDRDIQLLPEGDLTLVGERGVALSGGQRARVNLARAVYIDADIYILDDPLSAVDTHVGRILFDDCINGYLSRKLRILVTHQLQYLHDADNILVLDEGDAVGCGTYYELAESGIDFMSILEDEPGDSAIEVDKEDDKDALERRFSRQISCHPRAASKIASTTALMRVPSFTRQDSSFKDSRIMRSELGIAQEMQEVEVFEEKELPKEVKAGGAVGMRTYSRFFKAGYGRFVWFLVSVLYVFCQGTYLTADWWLSYWSNKEERFLYSNQTAADKAALNRTRDLSIYSTLVVALFILGTSRAFVFFIVILKSSESLHGDMFKAVLEAPIYFFDTVSIGRILNRFSKDMSLVDDMLAFTMFDLFQTSLVVIGILILVSANNPLVFALVVPLIVIFYFLRRYYIQSAREVKRIEGVARSPVFGHFSTTLLGLPTIRAFAVQELFTDLFYKYQDVHSGAWFTFLGCASWLSFRLDILCIIFIGAVAFISVAIAGQLNPGTVGLILAYTINITGVFQQCIRQSTEVENQMTSVERILEYADIEPESPPETNHKPPKGWPSRGSIHFEDMSFSYHRSIPDVLHNITVTIHSTEKIGVCGRTGAGKSSLLSTLFRTAEPRGSISIDGEDILDMGLRDLRSKISIIPQDPVLFSGSMRKNLDPFEEHSDIEVWRSLEEVQLKDTVLNLPGKLESEMAESGSNLSVGQRQLVCLARAILRRNKVLVIDEATANVDPITDALIQKTIREKFKDCTVLTIAHRLNTIMDSDRIMVLDAGRVKEIAEPYSLLRCKNSGLYGLVAQSGAAEAQKLFDIARKAYFARRKQETPSVMAPEEEMGALDSLEGTLDLSVLRSETSRPTLKVGDAEVDDMGPDKEENKMRDVASKTVNDSADAGAEEDGKERGLATQDIEEEDEGVEGDAEQPLIVKVAPDDSSKSDATA